METLHALFTRKSTRKFAALPVEDEVLRTVLRAGMSGPSAVNRRPWSFVVVKDKETLCRMADVNGRAANPLREAAAGILICGDTSRAYESAPDYWTVDAAIAVQNMTLAAHDLGLGSVWLGTWPQEFKVDGQKELFSLPEHILPHSILAIGYPAEPLPTEERDLYEPDRVHFEKW